MAADVKYLALAMRSTFLAGLFATVLAATPAFGQVRDTWTICDTGKRYTCVVDGDTIWFRGEKIRLLDIDAPEMGVGARCRQERVIAREATWAMAVLLNQGELKIIRDGRDRFKRTLAHVFVNGEDVGKRLMKMGLAVPYSPQLHHSDYWCHIKRDG